MAISPLDINSKSTGPSLNIARVADRFIRNWYVVLFSLLVGLSVAWAINRYTTKIYPVRASILIRENEENVGAKFLYNNSLVAPYRNYYNEFYIMRSYPLLQRVVEDLGFDVSYYSKGDIKTIERYLPSFPIRFSAATNYRLPYGSSLVVSFPSTSSFEIGLPSENNQVLKFNSVLQGLDSIEISGQKILINQVNPILEKWVGQEIVVQFNDPYQVAKNYSRALQLNWSQGGSAVVDLYMEGPVPDKIRDFMSSFIAFYQEYDVDKKNSIASRSIQFLDKQIDRVADSLRFYENQISKFAGKLTESPEKGFERITALGDAIDEKDLQIQLQERYYDYLEAYMNKTSDFSQVLLPSALGVADPVLSGLVSKLVEKQFELRVLQDKLDNSSNPLIQESREKIDIYKRDIAEGIRSAKEIMRINRNMFRDRIKSLQLKLNAESVPDRLLPKLQRSYKLNEELYNFLTQKRAEAAISQASTTSDIIIINPPESGGAIAPVPLKNYGIGILTGLLVPLLLFVLLEFFNDKIQSKEDIEKLCSVPVIATIGHGSGVNLAVAENSRSVLAESFRALRSNLNYFTSGKNNQVILVTSTISGEGKSFISMNLATVLAYTGKKVILVSGDMRKPSMYTDFKVSNQTGLSMVLSGQAKWEGVALPTSIKNLDFMPSGPIPPNPAELMLSEQMGVLMSELVAKYDYVVLDSPPVGLVSDALVLLSKVDHIIFVTRQNYTPVKAIQQLQNMVDHVQIGDVSIVLNDIKRVGMGYGYEYGYYNGDNSKSGYYN